MNCNKIVYNGKARNQVAVNKNWFVVCLQYNIFFTDDHKARCLRWKAYNLSYDFSVVELILLLYGQIEISTIIDLKRWVLVLLSVGWYFKTLFSFKHFLVLEETTTRLAKACFDWRCNKYQKQWLNAKVYDPGQGVNPEYSEFWRSREFFEPVG